MLFWHSIKLNNSKHFHSSALCNYFITKSRQSLTPTVRHIHYASFYISHPNQEEHKQTFQPEMGENTLSYQNHPILQEDLMRNNSHFQNTPNYLQIHKIHNFHFAPLTKVTNYFFTKRLDIRQNH